MKNIFLILFVFISVNVFGQGNPYAPTTTTKGSVPILTNTGSEFLRDDGVFAPVPINLGKIYNVKDPAFGAKGDGVENYDGGITSGLAVFSSTAATFVVGDVGKHIEIDSAGPSHSRLRTTIIGFTNSHTVTLNTTASSTVSAQFYFYSSDDTGPIQAAINAWNAGGQSGTIFLPTGIYGLWGALQPKYNSQLYVPTTSVPLLSGQKSSSIFFLGESAPAYDQTVLGYTNSPANGSILKSCIDGTTLNQAGASGNPTDTIMASILATKVDSFTYIHSNASYSWCDLYVKNLGFISSGKGGTAGTGPTVGGINGRRFLNTYIENTLISIDEPLVNSDRPISEVAGIFTVETNGGTNNVVHSSVVYGMKYGIIFGEHFFGDDAQVMACEYGFCPALTSAHASHIGRGLGQWNRWQIAAVYKYPDLPVNAPRITIGQMDVELGVTGWWASVGFFKDTANLIYGTGKFSQTGTSKLTAPIMSGGTNFSWTNIQQDAIYQNKFSSNVGAPYGIVWSDSVNAAVVNNISNNQAGTTASVNYAGTNDALHHVDFGMTSSAFTTSGILPANTGYIGAAHHSSGNIGFNVYSTGGPIKFSTDGEATASMTLFPSTLDLVIGGGTTDGTGQIQVTNNGTGERRLLSLSNSTAGTGAYTNLGIYNDNGIASNKGLNISLLSSTFTGLNNASQIYSFANGPMYFGTNATQFLFATSTGISIFGTQAASNGATSIAQFDGNVVPYTNVARDLGTSSFAWRDIYFSHTISESAMGASNSLGSNVSSATASGSDEDFQLTIVTSGAVAGTIADMTFGRTWIARPHCTISSANAATGSAVAVTVGGYIAGNATSTSNWEMAGAITAAGTYVVNCHCGE